ncbi:30S ribosomal protein S6 [Clostridiaceae bacterium HSG29]|nr:30S ribosomal protein S6 [Clostridiaceae bacterium HSG29]
MRKYEIIYIVKTTVDDERKTEILEEAKGIIETAGTVTEVEEMGKRRLAYEIKKNNEGFYTVISYEAEVSVNPILKKKFKLNEDVIRDLIVRVDK